MTDHHEQHFLSADRADHRVIRREPAQVILAGRNVGDGLLPAAAKRLDGFGERGEAAARMSGFRRGDLARPVGRAGDNQGLPPAGHLVIGSGGLLHQSPEQVLFHHGDVLHALQNGPAGSRLYGGLLFGHTVEGGEQLCAAGIQFVQ